MRNYKTTTSDQLVGGVMAFGGGLLFLLTLVTAFAVVQLGALMSEYGSGDSDSWIAGKSIALFLSSAMFVVGIWFGVKLLRGRSWGRVLLYVFYGLCVAAAVVMGVATTVLFPEAAAKKAGAGFDPDVFFVALNCVWAALAFVKSKKALAV